MFYFKFKVFLLFFSLTLFCQKPLLSAEYWDVKLGLQNSNGHYSGSLIRDKKESYGFFLSADYLNSSGFSLVYDHTKIDYRQGIKPIKQDSWFLSGRKTLRPDPLNGQLSLRLDAYHINNDDPSGNTDNVKILSPQISYLSYNKKHYLALAYTQSSYSKSLTVKQWTPTLGFSTNNKKDWLQVKGYFISTSNQKRSQGISSTKAFDLSMTHHLDTSRRLRINKIKANILLGERIYAVDDDAATVYNLSDVQQGGLSLSTELQITDKITLTLVGGKERFSNKIINDSYSSAYLYANLTTAW